MRRCEVQDLGRLGYGQALELQRALVEKRKQGLVPDQLLFVEHPHVITLGRNGDMRNLLANEDVLRRAGIEFFPTDRGGDVTYHGPGQIVGYPIFDLREWKRDVVAYVRAIEQAIIDTLAEFGISSGREPGMTGVWTGGKKIAAIGVHVNLTWLRAQRFGGPALLSIHRAVRPDQACDFDGRARCGACARGADCRARKELRPRIRVGNR
jgi:lipoyl(octanoyl) transferase